MILFTIIGEEIYYIYRYIMAATTKNRNGVRKLIEYNQGHQCIVPTNNLYWRKAKDKYKRIGSRNTKRVYWTRYMTWTNRRDLFKNKGNFAHNCNLRSLNICLKRQCIMTMTFCSKQEKMSSSRKYYIYYHRVSIQEGLNIGVNTSELMLGNYDKEIYKKM